MDNEKQIDVYPWAAPTEEQKQMFNALNHDEQLDMLKKALIEGEQSGDAGFLDVEAIKIGF